MARQEFLYPAPLTNGPELTDVALAELRPAREVLSAEEFAAVTSIRKAALERPPTEIRKVSVTIHLDPDIVEAFKATGNGWQTRINAELRDTLKRLRSTSAESCGALWISTSLRIHGHRSNWLDCTKDRS